MVDSEPLFFPGNTTDDPDAKLTHVRQRLPQLGRLNYLHSTNMALLSGAFVLAVTVDTPLVGNVLGLVVLLIWLQLPLLEIDEYGTIRENIKHPKSLYVHIAGTLLLALLLTGGWGFQPGLFITHTNLFKPDVETFLQYDHQLLSSLILALSLFGTTLGFLWFFEQEADQAAKDESPISLLS
ncbi:hypothetical protein [Halorussus caseinilyticus]|uniref:hypothetical protein n=1 Tax=Halorussus caseinilyticus TaxID=3034025 RepID=UPI0023E8105B|nr:hypothetical protein [Halorussus sp. DT72]